MLCYRLGKFEIVRFFFLISFEGSNETVYINVKKIEMFWSQLKKCDEVKVS